MATTEFLNTQLAESSRIKRPEDLWSFAWDTRDEEEVIDPEKVRQHNQMLLNALNELTNGRSS